MSVWVSFLAEYPDEGVAAVDGDDAEAAHAAAAQFWGEPPERVSVRLATAFDINSALERADSARRALVNIQSAAQATIDEIDGEA